MKDYNTLRKALEKYAMKNDIKFAVFVIAQFVICSFVEIVIYNHAKRLGRDLVTALMPLILGGSILLFGVFVYLLAYLKIKKKLDVYETEGKLDNVLDEFDSAKDFFDGKLKVNTKYLFGKRTGTIVEYSEVIRIYQYIHKTNFVEDYRMLMIVDNKGKKRQLCKLKTLGKSDAELRMFLGLAHQINPAIEFGYKRK